MRVRTEAPEDHEAVRIVNARAFGRAEEGRLVDALRTAARPFISLVADDGNVIGHIAFSPVTLQGFAALIMGLAPMAVLPDQQRRGVGGLLVRAGLEACEREGARAAVVLGHAAYYPRFGFVPAARLGLRCEYHVPEEAFMAMEIVPGALAGARGLIRYHAVFAGV